MVIDFRMPRNADIDDTTTRWPRFWARRTHTVGNPPVAGLIQDDNEGEWAAQPGGRGTGRGWAAARVEPAGRRGFGGGGVRAYPLMGFQLILIGGSMWCAVNGVAGRSQDACGSPSGSATQS
ncbi:hypothetical protein Aca07nite_46600 [Actinoplanes capillaceus]|uniref:Uncharacterized protein n=1 Tax=Actinoplanes campanulatus TaxID=113559 RepID=A0ABQ3WMG0_9ACTN|nr:hypothetical protein Aca07nite_46600 [Actinoplanes capillaceus]